MAVPDGKQFKFLDETHINPSFLEVFEFESPNQYGFLCLEELQCGSTCTLFYNWSKVPYSFWESQCIHTH